MFGFCLHLFLGLRLQDEYRIHLEGLLAASGNRETLEKVSCFCRALYHPLSYFEPIIPVAQKAGVGFRILYWKADILNCIWQHCCTLFPELGKYLLMLGVVLFTEAKCLSGDGRQAWGQVKFTRTSSCDMKKALGEKN